MGFGFKTPPSILPAFYFLKLLGNIPFFYTSSGQICDEQVPFPLFFNAAETIANALCIQDDVMAHPLWCDHVECQMAPFNSEGGWCWRMEDVEGNTEGWGS